MRYSLVILSSPKIWVALASSVLCLSTQKAGPELKPVAIALEMKFLCPSVLLFLIEGGNSERKDPGALFAACCSASPPPRAWSPWPPRPPPPPPPPPSSLVLIMATQENAETPPSARSASVTAA